MLYISEYFNIMKSFIFLNGLITTGTSVKCPQVRISLFWVQNVEPVVVAGTQWNVGTVAEMTSKPGSLKVNHLKWKLSLLTILIHDTTCLQWCRQWKAAIIWPHIRGQSLVWASGTSESLAGNWGVPCTLPWVWSLLEWLSNSVGNITTITIDDKGYNSGTA